MFPASGSSRKKCSHDSHPKRSAEREALMWTPAEMKLIAILLIFAADFEAVLKTVETQSHYVVAAPASHLLKPPRF